MTAGSRFTTGSARGFTLVEVLIAVALVGLLTALLFGSLGFGTRVVNVASARIDRSAQIATTQAFLLAALQDTQALRVSRGGSGQLSLAFDGAPDHMDAVTVPPAYLALGGLHWLHVAVEGQPGVAALVARWQTVVRGSAETPHSELRPSVLADRLSTVNFGYYGINPPDPGPQWHDQWRDSDVLPSLIRIAIVLADGTRVPEIMVAPRQAGMFGSAAP